MDGDGFVTIVMLEDNLPSDEHREIRDDFIQVTLNCHKQELETFDCRSSSSLNINNNFRR
jgi:hypothetical protein